MRTETDVPDTPGGRSSSSDRGQQRNASPDHRKPRRGAARRGAGGKGRILAGAVAAAAIAAVVAGLAWFRFGGGEGQQAMPQPPVTVTATEAATAKWQPSLDAVGTLRAAQQVEVAAEVGGIVEQVYFASGEQVDKGSRLLRQEVQGDRDELQGLLADLELARVEHERSKKLAGDEFASESQLDQRRATLQRARADVAAQRTLIGKKHVDAPFTGQVGIRRVDPGKYLAAGEAFVTLQKIDPLKVDFAVPQRHLGRTRPGQAVELRVDAYPDETFMGRITAVDPRVDEATRSVQVEAQVRNADKRLKPGMFVNVRVLTGEPEKQVTLPRTALSFNPYGDFVYVVESGGGKQAKGAAAAAPIVRQVFVRVGEQRGEQVAIADGIEPGQRVVTSGQHKLREGAAVRIDNSRRPGAQASVNPGNS